MSEVQRIGSVIAIDPARITEYKRLHAAIWPEVAATIAACNIRNYTIFLREPENLLFGYYEYHGTDLAADMERMEGDAIQSFVSQETPIVRITDSDGAVGTGYSYTIGTGGPSVMKLIERTLAPMLIGRDPAAIEAIWRDMLFLTHATTVGPIAAMAAIDVALWDLRCRRAALPLHRQAGGAQTSIALYTTEGGWLHLETGALVEDALKAKATGFAGAKIKVGRAPHEDVERLGAVREAVGAGFELFTDAIGWLEEPLPADDIEGHARLSRSTTIPIAVGESVYSHLHFRDYLQRAACSIVQVEHGRAIPSDAPGIGIAWDWAAIDRLKLEAGSVGQS